MDSVQKGMVYETIELIGTVEDKVETLRIMSKTTGSVTLIAMNSDIDSHMKTLPFDTLVLALEGTADVYIDGILHSLTPVRFIIIPAHASSHVVSKGKFKMMVTVIKSGYEDQML